MDIQEVKKGMHVMLDHSDHYEVNFVDKKHNEVYIKRTVCGRVYRVLVERLSIIR